jgi:hypothetical protein
VTEQEYGLKCLEVGMSDVLFKPLKREALATALKKWAPASAAVVQAQPSSTAAAPASSAAAVARGPKGQADNRPRVTNGFVNSSLSFSAPTSPTGVPRGRSYSLPATLRGLLDIGPRNLLFCRKEST